MADNSHPNSDSYQTRPSRTDRERVRSAARTLQKPRTASWIAAETNTPVGTTHQHLDSLVRDHILRKFKQGDQTLYCVDQLMAAYREVATLQREYDREELTAALESIQTQITEWKEAYGVENPNKLRVTAAEIDDQDEFEQRRQIAGEWEQLEGRLSIVQVALDEYDHLSKNRQ